MAPSVTLSSWESYDVGPILSLSYRELFLLLPVCLEGISIISATNCTQLQYENQEMPSVTRHCTRNPTPSRRTRRGNQQIDPLANVPFSPKILCIGCFRVNNQPRLSVHAAGVFLSPITSSFHDFVKKGFALSVITVGSYH